MELNRREAAAAIAGMVCLPVFKWLDFEKRECGFATEVGFSDGRHWYWAELPGDYDELTVDWLVIATDGETGNVLNAEVKFVGLGKFPLRRGRRAEAETLCQTRWKG